MNKMKHTKRLKAFSRSGVRQGLLFLPLFSIVLEVSARAIRKEKEIKTICSWKKDGWLSQINGSFLMFHSSLCLRDSCMVIFIDLIHSLSLQYNINKWLLSILVLTGIIDYLQLFVIIDNFAMNIIMCINRCKRFSSIFR